MQDCDSLTVVEPEQLEPPHDGLGLVHERVPLRVWVPVPQVLEHALQPPQLTELQPPLTGEQQEWVLHAWLSVWVAEPEQLEPPHDGLGLLHERVRVRVWVPPPQLTEHALQPDQLP